MIPLRGLKIGVLKSSMLTSVKLLKSRQAHVRIELQITAEVSKINRMKYGFNYKLWVFPQSVFGRLLLSLVQMIPPFFFFFISVALPSLEQVREDPAETLSVCQLFVGKISPKEQLYAPLTAVINVFTGG